MGLILEQVHTEGIAQLSYLVGDDTAGQVAVIDPRRDVDLYVDIARTGGLRITHIVETHIHADFVSGSRELQLRTGASIYGGKSDDYRFSVEALREGDELRLGGVTLRALHTPGHTPEHISLLVSDRKQGVDSFGLFTGDTLFNLDVGRPDLVGDGTEEKLARDLYHSIFDTLLPLGDRLEVYPGHGAGSACGTSIGDRKQSTIGNERLFNPALQKRSSEEFVSWLLGSLPEPPSHYAVLKELNARGAPVRGTLPVLAPLAPAEFQRCLEDGDVAPIDARSMLAFGGGHVPGALNIGLQPEFAIWVGWMIDPAQQVLLVVDSERDVQPAVERLFRLGYDNLAGYLHQGMTSWQNAGLPLERTSEWTVHELNRQRGESGVTVLDVRSDEEWKAGHVPGACHIYVPHLLQHLDELDSNGTIVAYCDTGYRASIAASLLQKHGFTSVVNVPGSWKAWTHQQLPVEGQG